MKTPDEIKKGLECCFFECDDTSPVDHCRACPYRPNGLCFRSLITDALSYIQQLEEERDSALGLIGRLMVILKKYNCAATNGCAYAAHDEIKKWLLEMGKPLPKPPKEEEHKLQKG